MSMTPTAPASQANGWSTVRLLCRPNSGPAVSTAKLPENCVPRCMLTLSSRARVLAAATGAAPRLTDDELGTLIGLNQTAAYKGQRDAEFAATAVIARGVLKDH